MLTVITGGSKNGKSHIAEKILDKDFEKKYYIATMMPYCDEAHEAIKRHREQRRGKGFHTIEKYTDIHEAFINEKYANEKSAVLLECACNLCANEMFTAKELHAAEKILSGIIKLKGECEEIVIVTNQVGEDGFFYPKETMEYIYQMGILNIGLCRIADRVIEAVYGIPVMKKGELLQCIF